WPPDPIDVGHGQTLQCPVLLMVAGASRHMGACLLPSARFRDVWIGHRRLLQEWGAVPHTLRWDTDGIEYPWSWYIQTEGWDLSWNSYVASAELDDLTVQERGYALNGLSAARRRLSRFRHPGSLHFSAALASCVEEANKEASSRPTSWSTERAAM